MPFVGVRNGMWRNTGKRHGLETSFACAAMRFYQRMFCCSAAATRTACVTLRRPHWTVKPTSSRDRWCAALSTWWVFGTVVCLWNPVSWVKNWKEACWCQEQLKWWFVYSDGLCLPTKITVVISRNSSKSNINFPHCCLPCMCYVSRCQ